jgi:FKBP-type peptidyl-prolyl cis-trans isomerase (trigger factor)
LRVTVAYKLEALTEAQAGDPERVGIEWPVAPPPVEERADGPNRIFSQEIDEATIQAGIPARLAELARTIRLPGYPQGQIPEKLLLDRYGERARHDVLRALAVDIIEGRLIAEGMIPSECTLHGSSRGGGAEIRFAATCLPDVPIGEMTSWTFEKWSAPTELLIELGIEQDDAELLLAQKLRQGILDKLDEAFAFTILPSLVDRELASIVKEADALGLTPVDIGGADWKISLSALAERRLRLGFVIMELARRFSLAADTGTQLETRVCDHILSIARIDERDATPAELMALSQ